MDFDLDLLYDFMIFAGEENAARAKRLQGMKNAKVSARMYSQTN